MVLRGVAAYFKNRTPPNSVGQDIFTDAANLLAGSSVIFDIGAHRGKMIRKFRQFAPNAVIHGFEPSLAAYEALRVDFAANERVVLSPKAVSDKCGTACFYENAFDETNSLLPSVSVDRHIDLHTRPVRVTEVETITLDDYVRDKNISCVEFVKIDVQGNTFAVLQGSEWLLRNKIVKWIYAEVEFIQIYKDEKRFSEIEMFMRSRDYSLVRLYNINHTERGYLAWADALFSAEK